MEKGDFNEFYETGFGKVDKHDVVMHPDGKSFERVDGCLMPVSKETAEALLEARKKTYEALSQRDYNPTSTGLLV